MTSDLQPVLIAALFSLLVFMIAVYGSRALQSRGSVQRRISATPALDVHVHGGRRSQRFIDANRTSGFLERASRMVELGGSLDPTSLRKQLIQAGFFSTSAVPLYHAVRLLAAGGLAVLLPLVAAALSLNFPGYFLIVASVAAALSGLILPSVALDRLRSNLRARYRNAFPDFMDLLVVCIESGQSLPGAIERVSKEIVQFCPPLGMNLHLVHLELRAGRTMSEALGGLEERTGIEEVRSLKLLLKQSEELGASIASTLRVFGDEMRNKRLMAAEAKAHALPVKMAVPLALFIFPIILIVILTPAVVRIQEGFKTMN